MGNHQDRKKLVENSIMKNTENVTDSGWETIDYTQSYLANSMKAPTGFKLTPLPKSLKIVNELSYHRRGPIQKNSKQRRWSQTRKVNSLQPLEKVNHLKSAKTVKDLANIAEEDCEPNDKKNSTVCVGGVSICPKPIIGLSPIKIKEKTKKIKVVPLASFILENINTPTQCAVTKVENWLKSTEKDVLANNFSDQAFTPIQLDGQQAEQNYVIENYDKEKHVVKEINYSEQVLKGKKNQKKVNEKLTTTNTDTISPIPSVLSVYEHENTLESCIRLEIFPNENNKIIKKKKRKRIAMRTTPLKKTEPLLVKKRKSCAVKNRIKGKELPIRACNVVIKNKSLMFEDNSPNNVVYERANSRYNLRTLNKQRIKGEKDDSANVKYSKKKNNKRNIDKVNDLLKDKCLISDTSKGKCLISTETPPSNDPCKSLTIGISKRKLSFYDYAQIVSCDDGIDSNTVLLPVDTNKPVCNDYLDRLKVSNVIKPQYDVYFKNEKSIETCAINEIGTYLNNEFESDTHDVVNICTNDAKFGAGDGASICGGVGIDGDNESGAHVEMENTACVGDIHADEMEASSDIEVDIHHNIDAHTCGNNDNETYTCTVDIDASTHDKMEGHSCSNIDNKAGTSEEMEDDTDGIKTCCLVRNDFHIKRSIILCEEEMKDCYSSSYSTDCLSKL